MRPRFITSAITLLVLVVIVGGAGYWGWKHVTAPAPGLLPSNVCQTKTVDVTLRANQVTVSVYNAGTKTGLAHDVMTKLTKRGFRAGVTGNTSENVKKVLVRTSVPDSAQARLVAAQFGVDVTVSDVDLGPGIDVVVGNKFKGLVANAPTSLTYSVDQEVCSSSTSSSTSTSSSASSSPSPSSSSS